MSGYYCPVCGTLNSADQPARCQCDATRLRDVVAGITATRIDPVVDLAAAGRDALFGPFEHKEAWEPDPTQYKNLLNDFEQTHEEIRVERVTVSREKYGGTVTVVTGNAITGKPKAHVEDGVWQYCPRRGEGGPMSQIGERLDVWGKDRTCSYCGSLHPDDFIDRLKAGEELGPTDKTYKAYIGRSKFYYQHLSEEQKREIVRMANAKEITFGAPGYWYVKPFFVTVVKEPGPSC